MLTAIVIVLAAGYADHGNSPDEGTESCYHAQNSEVFFELFFVKICVWHRLSNHNCQKKCKEVENRVAEHDFGMFEVF